MVAAKGSLPRVCSRITRIKQGLRFIVSLAAAGQPRAAYCMRCGDLNPGALWRLLRMLFYCRPGFIAGRLAGSKPSAWRFEAVLGRSLGGS